MEAKQRSSALTLCTLFYVEGKEEGESWANKEGDTIAEKGGNHFGWLLKMGPIMPFFPLRQ